MLHGGAERALQVPLLGYKSCRLVEIFLSMGTVKVQVPQGGWDEHLDELSTGITKPTNPNNVMQVLRGFSIPLTLKPTTRGFICLALNLGCLGRSWCLRRTRKYARTKNCLAVAREVRPSEDTSKWRWVRSVESLLERGRRLTTPSLLGDFFLAYLGSRPWHCMLVLTNRAIL